MFFGLWEESEVLGENLCRRGENKQTTTVECKISLLVVIYDGLELFKQTNYIFTTNYIFMFY